MQRSRLVAALLAVALLGLLLTPGAVLAQDDASETAHIFFLVDKTPIPC